MKKIYLFLVFSFLFIGVNTTTAQHTVQFNIFEPLPEIEYSAFIYSNNLAGMPRIAQFIINPKSGEVVFEGEIQWREDDNQGFQSLLRFRTNPFEARDFYNDEIGVSEITIAPGTYSNDPLLETFVSYGRPVGQFVFIVRVYDAEGNVLEDEEERLLRLENPAQTIRILFPDHESIQDPLSVLASWTKIIGASSYHVKANVRSEISQSLEEALNSGTPYVNSDVGLLTVVNLRTYLEREWLPGSEIVMQVSANIPGPSGGSELNSEIINFYLTSTDPTTREQILSVLTEVLFGFDEDRVYGFLNRLRDGTLQIRALKKPDGTPMTPAEIAKFLEYLKDNPDVILSFKKV